MKQLFISLFILLYFCPNYSQCQNTDEKWKQYSEIVNTGITLSFSYPNNAIIKNDENSRCVESNSIKAKSNIQTTLNWCIWMEDSSNISIDQSILEEKTFYKGKINVEKDTITIDGTKCIMVTMRSNLLSDPYRQIVLFTKFGTTFEIINNSGRDYNFESFCRTIKVISGK
jgi:hypothetical protein